jgi:hypothetical protein
VTHLPTIVAGKQARLKALLDEAWLLQAELTVSKRARLNTLLKEAWPLEEELNELHRIIHACRADRVMVQGPNTSMQGRFGRAILRHDVTERRIKLALLSGPLALKGQRYTGGLLVERCEDIPGADQVAVRRVLRHLVKRGFVRRQGNQFWRAA